MIAFFRDLSPAQAAQAGGKGRALAELRQAGVPVPNGFVLLPATFEGDELRPQAWEETRAALATLRAEQPGAAFAVRSSALSEDSASASFAGEFESVLDARDDGQVRAAIAAVRRSRHAGRVAAYSAAQGLDAAHEMAVVVQLLVPAEAAGVLFTANPLSGARNQMLINATWGLGEALVSGHVTPDTLVLDAASGALLEQQISAKEVMTVRGEHGARETAVPAAQQRAAVLDAAQAAELARMGRQIAAHFGLPMDIEWALSGGQFAIVQARPITTLREPPAEVWNDSVQGDYLWTSNNLGEAMPNVMTPATWSLMQKFMADTMVFSDIQGHPLAGNIGGRAYMNVSLLATLAQAFGMGQQRFADANKQVFGYVPAGLGVPHIPVGRWQLIREVLPLAVNMRRRVAANQPRLELFLASAPARATALRERAARARDANELLALWDQELMPFFTECSHMLEAGARRDGAVIVWVRRTLERLVGEADTNALLAGLNSGGGQLASLGPLLGLAQLQRGEIDRAAFAQSWGHRGPYEFEVSVPRPAEDPAWIDAQLAGLHDAPIDVNSLLARQQAAQTAAWARLAARYPGKLARLRRKVAQAAEAYRMREAARSEVVRVFWPLRAFVQRAGALTGTGGDIFFLRIEEILALLRGERAALGRIPARRAAYDRYAALPSYPAFIRGHFDPERWAADPARRSDVFDAAQTAAPASATISGFPGAAGVVEGRARVLARAEDGGALEAGEILVTTVTNVGWTPLFPRAAAVVTDVGAPLSHAAIVARELGIPAVVGCGNATMRIRTGDRLRVDGARGTVEILG